MDITTHTTHPKFVMREPIPHTYTYPKQVFTKFTKYIPRSHKYLDQDHPLVPPNSIVQTSIPHKPPDQHTVTHSIQHNTKFWIEDPTILFNNFEIIPTSDMSNIRRFNAMTRIIIIIAAIMFVMGFPAWYLFLGIALILVIILWFVIRENESIRPSPRTSHEYLRKPVKPILIPLSQSQVLTPIKPKLNIISRT